MSLEHGLRDLATSGRTPEATSVAGGLELAVAVGPDGLLTAGQEITRGDVADGAMKADAVVVLDETCDNGVGFVQGSGRGRADRVALDGLVVPLQLAVGLRVVR